jgi:acetyltransferase-like isoleucine patch superfamily enzyme
VGLSIIDRGTDNVISYSERDEATLNGTITIRGNGNHVAIGPRTVANNLRVTLGSNCKVQIGSDCVLGALIIHAAKNAELIVGKTTGFNGRVSLLMHEPGRLAIGSGCLLAAEVEISISDMHSIVDIASGKRINPARDVVLEDRVWIGQRALVLKGAHIEAGSVVGACAVVSGRLPANSLAVGVPAKVIRTGVTWDHRLL